MWSYCLRRSLLIIPTFIGITILTFLLLHLMPGDPVKLRMRAGGDALRSDAATQEVIEQENITESENQTQEIEEINETISDSDNTQEDEDQESEETTKVFEKICKETCNLQEFNLSNKSYNLKIEISDAKIQIDKITYEIISSINETQELIEQEVITQTNATVTTQQFQAVIGQPVKWKKEIKLDEKDSVKVKIPKNAENITAYKIIESGQRGIASIQRQEVSITGMSISSYEGKGILTKIWGSITGRSIDTSEKEITLEDNSTDYEVEYYTEAPQASEEQISNGKRITITGPDELHYENVLAFTTLENEIKENKIRLNHLVNDSEIPTEFDAYDLNENGLIDYIEWVVPHLSEQTYEIIIITAAKHLDENKTFIADIYNQTRELDDIWSPTIQENQYIRVTFEKDLTSDKDITIYPGNFSGNPAIEVYEINGTEIITEFSSLSPNQYNKAYLTNLNGEQNSFDLKVIGGSLEINHILDPPIPLTSAVHSGSSVLSEVSALDGTWYLADMKDLSKALYLNFSSNLTNGSIVKTYVRQEKGVTVGIYAQSDTAATNPLGTFIVTSATGEWINITLENFTSPTHAIFFGEGTGSGTDPKEDFDYITAEGVTTDNPPTVTLSYPSADYYNDTSQYVNLTFNASVTDDIQLKNCSLYHNYTGTWHSNQTQSITGTSNVTTFTLNDLTNKTFIWNIKCFDNASNSAFASQNRTVKLNWTFTDNTHPTITIHSPLNDTYNTTSVLVNISASDSNLNTTWYNWNGTNTTYTSPINISFAEGGNTLYAYANDTYGNENSTSVSFTIDTCTPNMTNTSWSEWINLSCVSNQMNQSRNRIEYDSNNCGEIENTTHYEYQLVGPTYANTTWSDWYNITSCQINDTITQEQNKTQYDIYACASNTTFYNYTYISCNYCSYNVTNITGNWQNQTACQANNTLLQNRSITEYDSNYSICYGVTGLPSDLWNSGNNNTYWEYQEISCDYDGPPTITIHSPLNDTYNELSVLVNISTSDSDIDITWYNWNGTNITYTSPINVTFSEGSNTLYAYANDTAGNENSTSVTFFIDTTGPSCTVVSVTPSDLIENSTGLFEAIINCTDTNNINISRFFITKTVEGFGSPGIPNIWSIRPPENNKAQNATCPCTGAVIPKILRADGRADGKWYDFYGLFNDNFTYAVNDNTSIRVNIINGSNWALLNYSFKVEPTAFRNMVYLSRGFMEKEEKKDYQIWKDNGLLVKFWNLEAMRNASNYTLTAFGNFNYTGNPNKDMKVYYCNSSYNVTGGISPIDDLSNCVFLHSLSKTDLDLPRTYESRNSSYHSDAFTITNKKIGGITATEYNYIYYNSLQTGGTYFLIRYANGTSGTNISFNNSNVAWYTTNGAISFTQAEFTPDIWISQIKEGDKFQLGVYVEDTLGNNLTNFTIHTDEIGDINHSISSPNIEAYMQGVVVTHNASLEDKDLNGTYHDNMTIHINIALDPDAPGTVNHSLYLMNTDGSLNYTINSSFYSPDDSDVHVYFDTNNVLDGLYKMQINATADDDPNDKKSHITTENFTIDNTHPTITIHSPLNDTYNNASVLVNITASDANLNITWYNWNGTNIT